MDTESFIITLGEVTVKRGNISYDVVVLAIISVQKRN